MKIAAEKTRPKCWGGGKCRMGGSVSRWEYQVLPLRPDSGQERFRPKILSRCLIDCAIASRRAAPGKPPKKTETREGEKNEERQSYFLCRRTARRIPLILKIDKCRAQNCSPSTKKRPRLLRKRRAKNRNAKQK